MTQDTRKDRRVKIVSLNVRYKSATVDEFIENHSHDVSKGGIFIKTANPFPPGTLLKFEIRLSGDQAVIAGVGRVVWKRESGGSTAERPAGMGVKFIKVDDTSKQTIDKLVLTKADAGSAYESESPNDEPTAIAPPPEPRPSPAAATTPALGARASMARKGTMMGLGAVSPSEPPPAGSSSKPPAVTVAPVVAAGGNGGSFFPETGGAADMPPKQEQTVMKQAAELLEEALKEAGGSMAEVGHNPLFTSPTVQATAPAEAKKDAEPARTKELESTVNERKRVPSNPPPENEPDLERTAVAAPTDLAATVADEEVRAAPKPKPEVRAEPAPSTARESPSAKSVAAVAAVAATDSEERKVKTVPPKARAVEVEPTATKKGGAGAYIALFAVVAVVGIGLIMFRDKLFGGIAPAPTTSQTAATTTTPPPVKSTAPTTSAPAATTEEAVDAAAAAVQDAATKDAAAPVDAARAAVNPVAPLPTQTWTQPTATATQQPTATATATQPPATATATATQPPATATQTVKPPPPPPPPPTNTGAPVNPY